MPIINPAQAELSSFRWGFISTGSNPNPTSGTALNVTVPSAPLFVMSPVTTTGMQTTGLLFMLRQPPSATYTPAVAGGGGFTVTPWILDPNSGTWSSGASFSADYNQVFTTFDFDACPLYFTFANVSTPGFILVGICEQ